MSKQFQYSFLHIPKTHSVDESATRYRDLRLQALKASPESFSSTFEIESQFTLNAWKERILQDERENFVCVAMPIDPSETLQTQWVGQVTLRGPVKEQDFILPQTPGQPVVNGEDEEKWQMLSLFILPEHQGQGLGQNLIREALRYLQDRRQKPRVLVRLMTKAQNTATIRLYQKLGFEIVGKCTLAEALVANGDSDLILGDGTDAKYTEQSGLVMTFRLG